MLLRLMKRGVFARPQIFISCKFHLDLVTELLKLGLPVKDLKGSKQFNLSEFDEAIGLEKNPEFEWWDMIIDL